MTDITQKYIADRRDNIVFGEPYDRKKYLGGSRSFDKLTLGQIKKLEALGVLDMDDAQNDCPTVGEIIEFLRERTTNGWYAHGYCISPERNDFRISFEGVGKETKPSYQDLIDFTEMFRLADEFNVNENGLWCWYD